MKSSNGKSDNTPYDKKNPNSNSYAISGSHSQAHGNGSRQPITLPTYMNISEENIVEDKEPRSTSSWDSDMKPDFRFQNPSGIMVSTEYQVKEDMEDIELGHVKHNGW